MSWTRWILGAGLAAACTVSAPGMSLAASHQWHRPVSHHHVKKGLLPHLPGVGMMRVYHGVYVGTTWPALPGAITLRQTNGQTVAITVMDTTPIVFVATGEVGDLLHGMIGGRLMLTVVAIKEHGDWVAETMTARLNAQDPVHPMPLPVVTPSSAAQESQ
ncbi:MAG: hypothetical protein FE78DRAFT_35292 [Acidomyces sp. 'richmondensis']|nr:MAG: hypothetical protein FE78DRAFT_35292 [Acidomyces sp. 'richmondensis']